MQGHVCVGMLLLVWAGGIRAEDRPREVVDRALKGTCTLQARDRWEQKTVGNEALPALDRVRILPDGGVAAWGLAGGQILLLNGDGTLRGRFGKQGEGPGCWRMVEEVLVTPGGLWVVDNDRLHRFTLQGEWQEDHRLPPRFHPGCLLNDAMVLGWWQDGAQEGQRRAVWKIGTEKPEPRGIAVGVSDKTSARMNGMQVAVEIPGVTPGHFMAWGGGRWVWGQNGRYILFWEDLPHGPSVGLEVTGRDLQPLPPSFRETYRPWAASLPETCTPWRRLGVDGQRRIWVEVTPVGEERRICWDLFSAQGDLLWKVEWTLAPGLTLRDWDRRGDVLALLLEDGEGELRIQRVTLEPPL